MAGPEPAVLPITPPPTGWDKATRSDQPLPRRSQTPEGAVTSQQIERLEERGTHRSTCNSDPDRGLGSAYLNEHAGCPTCGFRRNLAAA